MEINQNIDEKQNTKEVMSDSISKYNQLVEEGVITPDVKAEDVRKQKILDLLAAAAKAGKAGEVELRAREVMKEFGSNSLLLGLEIACQELI